MAENFRNKQWFKNLSQERKDKICKKFDIDEKTLKKAGRETKDGRIVIDILRIDHLNTVPELWNKCYDAYNKYSIFSDDQFKWDLTNINDMIMRMHNLYSYMHPEYINTVFKYKSNLKNDLYVKDTYERAVKWINTAKEYLTDKDYVKYCSFQVYSQCRCLLESDLKIIKS